MMHYFAILLIPNGVREEKIEEWVGIMMEQFSEDLHSAIQTEKCDCVMRDGEHLLEKQPDSNCNSCYGCGVMLYPYNPEGKYDWYAIGGRYNGWVTGMNSDPKTTVPEGYALKENHSLATDYIKLIQEGKGEVPWIIITPDSKWCEAPDRNFGPTTDPQWRGTVMNLLEMYKDYQTICLDIHQ